jgi:hypothetical protein
MDTKEAAMQICNGGSGRLRSPAPGAVTFPRRRPVWGARAVTFPRRCPIVGRKSGTSGEKRRVPSANPGTSGENTGLLRADGEG